MKQPPNTTYTVRVLGNTETRISQLEQLYLRYKQEKPLRI